MKVAELQIQDRARQIETIRKPRSHPAASRADSRGKGEAISSFSSILQKKLEENRQLRFSAHAVRRMEERQLLHSDNLIERLETGVQQLERKGAKSSLVLVDDTAFLVSVKNRTIITAMNKQNTMNQVFTNIDSVIFV